MKAILTRITLPVVLVVAAGLALVYSIDMTIGADSLPIISYWNTTFWNLEIAHCSDLLCSSAILTTVDDGGNIGESNSITVGAFGLPVISYSSGPGGTGNLKMAICYDHGCSAASLVTVDNLSNLGEYNSLTIGIDGLPIIGYFDDINNDLKIAHCNDLTCNHVSIIIGDKSGNVGATPSITIGLDGLPIISYYDDGQNRLKIAHCSNGFCVPYFRRR